MARLIVRVIGEGPRAEESEALAADLNPVLLGMPPMAIDAARRELVQLGGRVGDLLDAAVPAILEGRSSGIEQRHAEEQLIDRHHAAIVGFLEQVLHAERSPDISRSAVDLIEAADYLEAIADLVDKEMIPLYQRHAGRGTETDPQYRERLRLLAGAVRQEFRRALQAVGSEDQELARAVIGAKSELRGLERAVIDFQLDSDPDDGQRRLRPNALERELAESLRRSYSLIRRFVRVGTGLLRAERDNER
jgi:Na+/phosphate symporter